MTHFISSSVTSDLATSDSEHFRKSANVRIASSNTATRKSGGCSAVTSTLVAGVLSLALSVALVALTMGQLEGVLKSVLLERLPGATGALVGRGGSAVGCGVWVRCLRIQLLFGFLVFFIAATSRAS